MLYADDLQSKKDMETCLEHPLSLLVSEVEDPRKFGVVAMDKHSRIMGMVEKPIMPPSNLVSTGVMVLDSRIFKYPASRHPNGEYYLTDSLARMAREHEIKAVRASFWLPIGYPEDIARAEKILRQRKIRISPEREREIQYLNI